MSKNVLLLNCFRSRKMLIILFLMQCTQVSVEEVLRHIFTLVSVTVISRNRFRLCISLSNHTREETVLHLVQESIHSKQCRYHSRLLTSHTQPDLKWLDCIFKTYSTQQLDNLLAWYFASCYQILETNFHQR